MTTAPTIWCNALLPGSSLDLLQQNSGGCRLIVSAAAGASNLHPGGIDPMLGDADIAFGQPDPQQIIDTPGVRWVHLTSAGYTRYDTDAFRSALTARGGVLTNSSAVYADPCAQHLLAMMMSLSRNLPVSLDEQRTSRQWNSLAVRGECRLLGDQQVLIYGFGAIAARLAELLRPLGCGVTGVRRRLRGDESIPTVTIEQGDRLLRQADHVVNILPASPSTIDFFNADRFGAMKHGANFYNIGRGSTVDMYALRVSLETHKLGAAYLDVTSPEPLPSDDELWQMPRCYITPHAAGGHRGEADRLVRHFLNNLRAFRAGDPLSDRVS